MKELSGNFDLQIGCEPYILKQTSMLITEHSIFAASLHCYCVACCPFTEKANVLCAYVILGFHVYEIKMDCSNFGIL